MRASIPPEILNDIEQFTGTRVTGFSFSSGGCINHGGKLVTSDGVYFLKWNDKRKYPGMFRAEAQGLALLRKAAALKIPKAIHTADTAQFQFLLLEYVEESPGGSNYWNHLGAGLAALHRHSSSAFGLDHDNYIGSLPQRNKPCTDWAEFFIEQRLRVQLRIARDQRRLEDAVARKFEVLFTRLSSLLPHEPPALLHGDLWGGNLLTSEKGEPCLIDPAVYYGHREADLAMTQLFGGFDHAFLETYVAEFPLAPGHEGRFDIFNLYPLLVHVNLFGGGYGSQVLSILKRFT